MKYLRVSIILCRQKYRNYIEGNPYRLDPFMGTLGH